VVSREVHGVDETGNETVTLVDVLEGTLVYPYVLGRFERGVGKLV